MEYPPAFPYRVYTVSELSARIRQTISAPFREILVEGEISNQKLYPSGHMYCTLKDDSAMIRVVIFNYATRYPGNMTKDGDAVICKGRLDVYEKRGEYQLIVDFMEVKGLGLLQLQFQALKEKLFKEGLFDENRKKPIPLVPRSIGIVTSPAGAVVHDMLRIIREKFENMSVLIYPVKVQGEGAAAEIVEGIEYFNIAKEVDVIIIGRGGGSMEDLAAFNEEIVARAIARCDLPIISAVGHEIDFTIADFVADLRAPTPTAAAECVVSSKMELLSFLADTANTMRRDMKKAIERARLALYETMLNLKEKKDYFTNYRLYIDELTNNLIHGVSAYIGERRNRYEALSQRLTDLNPDNILKRGYSITVNEATGEIVTDVTTVTPGDSLLIRLSKGYLGASVKETHRD